MKYRAILMGCFALALSACNDTVLLTENASALRAEFVDTDVNQFENVENGQLTVQLSAPAKEDTHVRVAIQGENNVRENTNYFIHQKEYTIAKGDKSVKIDYTLVDDKVTNEDRSFQVAIMEVSGAEIDQNKSIATVNILDDESDVAVGFGEVIMSCRERLLGSADKSYEVQIPIQLTGEVKGPIQITVQTKAMNNCQEGVHYSVPNKIIEVFADKAVYVPVMIIDDNEVNDVREFQVEITHVIGAKSITATKRCNLSITNDDLGIYFGKEQLTATELDGKLQLPIKALWPVEEEVNITLTFEGTAVENTHFVLQKNVSLALGEDEVLFDLDLLHEDLITSDRNLTISIASLDGGAQVYNNSKCTINIHDMDTPVSMGYANCRFYVEQSNLLLPITIPTALEHDAVVSVHLTGNVYDEDEVKLEKTTVTIPAGKTSVNIPILLRKGAPELFDFGVEIHAVQGAKMNEELKSSVISQYENLDRTAWTVPEVSSQKVSDGGGKDMILSEDDDTGKFWHSEWSPNAPLPHHLIIDMQQVEWGYKATLMRRNGNTDTKTVEIHGSVDRENWTKMGVVSYGTAAETPAATKTKTVVFDKGYPVRYIKLLVTESNRAPFASISRFYLNRKDK